MDDLTARLAELLRRYKADFQRMVRDAEFDRATEAFREEVDALDCRAWSGRRSASGRPAAAVRAADLELICLAC
jgi:hypothetical protein